MFLIFFLGFSYILLSIVTGKGILGCDIKSGFFNVSGFLNNCTLPLSDPNWVPERISGVNQYSSYNPGYGSQNPSNRKYNPTYDQHGSSMGRQGPE